MGGSRFVTAAQTDDATSQSDLRQMSRLSGARGIGRIAPRRMACPASVRGASAERQTRLDG
jgi:hypothetical protein